MTNSQVWHSDASSMAGTDAPASWNSDQMKNSQARTVKLVIQNSVSVIDFEAKEECNILCVTSISFSERVKERLRTILNRLPGDEMEAGDKLSYLGNVHDFINARSDLSWKRLLREPSFGPKYRSETNCTEIVRCDSKINSRTIVGDLGSVRIEFGYFYLGDAVSGERRGGDEAHEGSSCILGFCIMCWKSTRIPQSIIDWENKLEWFQSTNQYRELDGIDGEPVELDTLRCRFSKKSKD